MSIFRTLLTRHRPFRPLSNMTPELSEEQIRALNPLQLLSYALQQSTEPSPSANSGKRKTDQQGATHLATTPDSKRTLKKRKKEFDMSRYGQRSIALKVTYQGWQYHGFAAQPTSKNTVEHHLFAALLKTKLIVSRESCGYSRAGRTDVGVSAMGQVVGLRVRSMVVAPSCGREELDYLKVMNGSLPDGIRILAWSPVSDGGGGRPVTYEGDPEAIRAYWGAMDGAEGEDVRRPGAPFSARFDAVFRSYKYFFPRGGLDVGAMREAAGYFVGRHDFRNFCRIDENVKSFERLMFEVDVRRVDGERDGEFDMFYIFVKGQAFLWHQVRCMAAVLFDVGKGHEKASIVKRMLGDVREGGGKFSNGRPHYRMAAAGPLLLYECGYPATVLKFPVSFEGVVGEDGGRRSGFEKVDGHVARCYADLATKAAIVGEVLKMNDCLPCFTVSGSGRKYEEVREARKFMLDGPARHIPYDERECDVSVEVKQERAAEKRRVKEVGRCEEGSD